MEWQSIFRSCFPLFAAIFFLITLQTCRWQTAVKKRIYASIGARHAGLIRIFKSMANTALLSREEILSRIKPIDPKSHKGSLGHVLIIGGSHGKIGAISLAVKAALKTGCGLATSYVPECGYVILQTTVPEAMVITDKNEKVISDISFAIQPDAIGIGPGMGQEEETINAFHEFLKKNTTPLVIDADGINILSQNKQWLELLPGHSIITPHPKELERLIGKCSDEDEIFEKVVALSNQFNLVVVLKGAPTSIICNDRIYRNSTGNIALATAGSGDVLTGIITSLLAQGYTPSDAALVGVYLHGLTADLAVPDMGFHSFIAGDIVNYLGKAWLAVYNQ